MKRLLQALLSVAFIVTGVVAAGMGLKGFLLSSNFIDGGVTGVSMLLSKTTRRATGCVAAGGQPAVHSGGLPAAGLGVSRYGARWPFRGSPPSSCSSRFPT